MELVDILFPLSIGPLTYKSPDRYSGSLTPGMLVTAEVRKSLQKGIIYRKPLHRPEGPLKHFIAVDPDVPPLPGYQLDLLRWMAGYYLAPEGIALKTMIPREHFESEKPTRRTKKALTDSSRSTTSITRLPEVLPEITSEIRNAVAGRDYGTYLLSVPTMHHEIAYLSEIILDVGNAIVLLPETGHLPECARLLKARLGDRLTTLHGDLTKAEKRLAFRRILGGESDIVLGTRLAVFAPLKAVSLIVVLQEQNRSYKNLEGLRYHARDVAVMLGYMQKATVVLSSSCPSFESLHNTTQRKYRLLRHDAVMRGPKVEIINMKRAPKQTSYLSRRALDASISCLKRSGAVLYLINRKGYARIHCSECNHSDLCPECGIALVYHKQRSILTCHYCGYTLKPSATCRKCGGTRLELSGAGTERIAADIERLLKIRPLRLDRDVLKERCSSESSADNGRHDAIVVGTKAVLGRTSLTQDFDLCVFINPDQQLNVPDFRSAERLFQEMIRISEQVRPQGSLLIQTRMPEAPALRHIKNYDLWGFHREELALRRSLSYPPFSRMVAITVRSTGALRDTLVPLTPPSDGTVEVLGPVSFAQKGRAGWKLLLKSESKEKLHAFAQDIARQLEGRKGLRIVVDVDPIEL